MPPEDGTVVNDSAVEETASTDSTPVENNSPSADEVDTSDIEASFDDGEGFGDGFETDSEDTDSDGFENEDAEQEDESIDDQPEEPVEPEAEEQSEDQPQTKADARKEQLNTEIRDLVAERNRMRQEVEQLNNEVYKPATADELVEKENPDTGDYYTRVEAELEAMKQERQVERYNNQVAESRLSLSTDARRALEDFPMFDETSPEYNKELASQAEQLINPNLIFDQNTNQLIGSRVSPYNVYKTIADAHRLAATKGQAQAQKATAKMMANADNTSGSHQTPKKPDYGLDAFDEEANKW